MELRTRIKNRTHHILDRNHVTLLSCTDLFGEAGRQLLDQIEIPSLDDLLLKAHLELLDYIKNHINQTERWTKDAFQKRIWILLNYVIYLLLVANYTFLKYKSSIETPELNRDAQVLIDIRVGR